MFIFSSLLLLIPVSAYITYKSISEVTLWRVLHFLELCTLIWLFIHQGAGTVIYSHVVFLGLTNRKDELKHWIWVALLFLSCLHNWYALENTIYIGNSINGMLFVVDLFLYTIWLLTQYGKDVDTVTKNRVLNPLWVLFILLTVTFDLVFYNHELYPEILIASFIIGSLFERFGKWNDMNPLHNTGQFLFFIAILGCIVSFIVRQIV